MTEQTPPMARPRVAAGALFVDDAGAVLLVKPTYKDGWDIPGGYVEPGETPMEACRREVKEELGFELPFLRLLVVDWAPSQAEGDKVLFLFDGGRLHHDTLDAVILQTDELQAIAFHSTSDLDSLMPSRLSRRIRAAVQARSANGAHYLEHGDPPNSMAPPEAEAERHPVSGAECGANAPSRPRE